MDQTVKAFAPAKLNLTLHVTGQRADGYHLLDSLVVFASVGDKVSVRDSKSTTLKVTGPMAEGVPTDERNLVVKAARQLGITAEISLEKHLPAAAGIGGGSSDAAATLRALCKLHKQPLPPSSELIKLGADVPVCAETSWQRMAGIGEQVSPFLGGVSWPVMLVNPRIEVQTPAVFKALSERRNAPMTEPFPQWTCRAEILSWLKQQRNDLEAPAIETQPVIADVLSALNSADRCDLARMSGSGATCFGLFADTTARDAAARQLLAKHPSWWISATEILP